MPDALAGAKAAEGSAEAATGDGARLPDVVLTGAPPDEGEHSDDDGALPTYTGSRSPAQNSRAQDGSPSADGDEDEEDDPDFDLEAEREELKEALEASERERATMKPSFDGKGVGLLYDARMVRHRSQTDDEHPEQPRRITRVFKHLENEGLVERCVRVPCRLATQQELELAHTSKHATSMLAVERMSHEEALAEQAKYRSVYLSPESIEASLLSAGACLEATERVCTGDLSQAVCIVRPPGHHAEPSCAMGFCLFGNVGVAVAEAQHRGWSKRTLIVDWDIHHGNGTQEMFYEDSAVLFFSVHRYDSGRFFPGGPMGHFTSHGTGEGEGYSVNVPWEWRKAQKRGDPPPGDGEYMHVWEHVLMPIARDFKPDLVVVSAGFDAAVGDPLGGCKVTPACYHELTRQLMELADGRMVVVLEGGYNLNSISKSMAACVHALLGDPPPGHAPDKGVGERHAFPKPHQFHADLVDKVRTHLAQYWPSLREEGEEVVVEAVEIRVPAAALHGTLAEMEKALQDHVDEEHCYEKLKARQQALLFHLEDMPKPPPQVLEQVGWTAMRQSFKARSGSPYLLPIVDIISVEQAMHNVNLALQTGADGVWLVNNGHAHTPPEAALGHIAVQRTNLKGTCGGAAGKAGRAQLDALAECFTAVRENFGVFWIGISLPQLPPAQAFKWVSSHCPKADGVWLHHLTCRPADIVWEKSPDGGGVPEHGLAVRMDKWMTDHQPALKAVKRERQIAHWKGLVFGCVAGHHQEMVHEQQEAPEHMDEVCQALLTHSATLASSVCDVVVTSSLERGKPCPAPKVSAMAGVTPLALLSSCMVSDNPATIGSAEIVLIDAAALSGENLPHDAERAPADFDADRLRTWVQQWRSESEAQG